MRDAAVGGGGGGLTNVEGTEINPVNWELGEARWSCMLVNLFCARRGTKMTRSTLRSVSPCNGEGEEDV